MDRKALATEKPFDKSLNLPWHRPPGQVSDSVTKKGF